MSGREVPEPYLVTGIRAVVRAFRGGAPSTPVIWLVAGSLIFGGIVATPHIEAALTASQTSPRAASANNTSASATVSTQAPPAPSSTSPTTNTASTAPTSMSNGSAPRASYPGICTTTAIPYPITYEDDPLMPLGQTSVMFHGMNGSHTTCTPDSNGYIEQVPDVQPVPEVDWRGTKVVTMTPSSQPTQSVSYNEAQTSCLALGTGGSSAFEQCMHAYGY